ncbi:MAG TPA: hypothetical protein PKZ16_02065 [bacterium]|nr:hypothetical protein [bacterium]HPL95619.1 hypothetical protein [bacterium]
MKKFLFLLLIAFLIALSGIGIYFRFKVAQRETTEKNKQIKTTTMVDTTAKTSPAPPSHK